MFYKKIENSIYFASNANRLLGDHKSRTDGNFVVVLGACVFDSRLISSLICELSENLPLKLPDPYSTRIDPSDY